MGTYERLADLPLRVDRVVTEPHELPVSEHFTRRTTVFRLESGGEAGRGEDVTYESSDHHALDAWTAFPDLAGEYTLDSFSQRLEQLDLFPADPAREVNRAYRRWALESAALDLALRTDGRSLAQVLERERPPLRFVVSLGLGSPPRLDEVRAWLALDPNTRFKLDANPDWTDELVAELAATGAVETVDLKGYYAGTPVETAVDPELYRRVAEGLPQAWLEDPVLDERTDAALAPHRDRITWDAPFHSLADVDALEFAPRTLNFKPSRFGSLFHLMEAYDACEERGIEAYGGGQFELSVGRLQIQELARLFHPSGPNDVAPAVCHGGPRPGLPVSPLPAPPLGKGFA